MGERLRDKPAVGAELTIDLGALAENYRYLRKQVGTRTICAAAVKANAYGTGIFEAATALARAGCEVFFTATLNEATELRQILPAATIYVLNGLATGTEQVFADFNLRPVLNDPDQIDVWALFARSRSGHHQGARSNAAAIHFDTGMNRLGLMPSDVRKLFQNPERVAAFEVSLVMSHLACADTPDHPMNRQQQRLFAELLAGFRASHESLKATPGSLANSAGVLSGADFHFDLVRPGVALYGGNPFEERPNPMMPVITLQGAILQTRTIKAGDGVGYGLTFRASSPRTIATVDVGYADGYLRAFSNRATAIIGTIKAPVIGRVSMDMLAVDVTDIPTAHLKPGTPVTLLGGGVSLDDASRASGLSCYELLTLLGNRYKRRYVAPAQQMIEVTGSK